MKTTLEEIRQNLLIKKHQLEILELKFGQKRKELRKLKEKIFNLRCKLYGKTRTASGKNFYVIGATY